MAEQGRRFSTSGDVLQAALRKEEAAYRFYDGLLKAPKADFVRELIEKLRDEEGKHIRMIRQKITQLNLGRG